MRIIHEHDCEGCKLVGVEDNLDLYVCADGFDPSVVVRYGSKPHEYASYPIDMLDSGRIEPNERNRLYFETLKAFRRKQ